MKTKYELIRFIQSLVRPRIHSVQVSSKDDQRALIKELDKQTKQGPVTVLLVRTQTPPHSIATRQRTTTKF